MASQPLIGYCLGYRPSAVEFFILAIQDYSEVVGTTLYIGSHLVEDFYICQNETIFSNSFVYHHSLDNGSHKDSQVYFSQLLHSQRGF